MTKNFEYGKKDYLLLSCQTKAILFGSILGDGSLKIKKKCLNANFAIRHSFVQKDYFLWKRNQLKNDLSFNFDKDIYEQLPNIKNITEFSKHKLRYQSKTTSSLTYLYHLVTKNNKICIKRK
jgi:hypothetical protein